MRSIIQRWGNRLARRIPEAFAQEIRLEQDTAVLLTVDDGRRVIDPVYDLDDRVRQITDANQHDEFDWGPPVGREAQ